jgi:hypothetical protein
MSNQRKFIASLIENLPEELSVARMQEFIESPKKITDILKQFEYPLEWFIESQEGMKLLTVHPKWDFRILVSEKLPKFGIAVSKESRLLGSGWKLSFKRNGERKKFVAPCCCCCWEHQISNSQEEYQQKRGDVEKRAVDLTKKTCDENGINVLVIHCWFNHIASFFPNDTLGKSFFLIDPYIGNNWKEAPVNVEKVIEIFGDLLEVICQDKKDGREKPFSLSSFFK